MKLPMSTNRSNSIIVCAENPIRAKATPTSPRKMKIKSITKVIMMKTVMSLKNGHKRTVGDLPPRPPH